MIIGIIRLIVLVVDAVCSVPVIVSASSPADAERQPGVRMSHYGTLLNDGVGG